MWRQRLMGVVWPAFLAAAALEMLVFAAVDPRDVHWLGRTLAWPAQATYTAAFFAFWCVALGACALTRLLAVEPETVSGRPAD